MEKIPFTSYDFWAYLSAGFMLLFVADQVAGTRQFERESWTAVQGVVAVSCAYAVGHLIAGLSTQVFERVLVARLLGYPRHVLFGEVRAWPWIQRLMPGYFRQLPEQTRLAAIQKGLELGIGDPGDSLFHVAFARARSNPAVMGRLDNFLNQYGFCRNTALVAFVDAGLLYWAYRWNGGPAEWLFWSWAALAVGIGMTFRYLKFLRHYAMEVLTSYAHGKEEP